MPLGSAYYSQSVDELRMQIEGQGFTVKESKFDYFFGRVTSSPTSQQRSLQNRNNLLRLGIDEAAGGRERLMAIFAAGLTAQITKEEEKEYGIVITRKVEVSGTEVTGAIKIGYFYRSGDTSTIPEVVTIIPKIYT
jgi:hypothetical protein